VVVIYTSSSSIMLEIGMPKRFFFVFLNLTVISIPILAFDASTSPEEVSSIDNGARIHAKECASCHGVNLEGHRDWMSQNENGTMRAPPQNDNGHTLHHPDKFLFTFTKFGGAEMLKRLGVKDVISGMPAYSKRLSEQEIWDALDFIKSKWSDRSRKYQKTRTELDEE
jgi:mono/diheme cytochrome c family protein